MSHPRDVGLHTPDGGYADRITAHIAFAPAGVVFGYRQINAMLEGTMFEPLGYDIERRARNFERLTKLTVGVAMLADRPADLHAP